VACIFEANNAILVMAQTGSAGSGPQLCELGVTDGVVG